MENSFDDFDTPSTGKRRSKRKPVKKSNHKHIYEDVILTYSNDNIPCRGKRCTICSKIETVGFFTKKIEGGYFQIMTADEIMSEYSNLPVINL